jgi:hypothetical protein
VPTTRRQGTMMLIGFQPLALPLAVGRAAQKWTFHPAAAYSKRSWKFRVYIARFSSIRKKVSKIF